MSNGFEYGTEIDITPPRHRQVKKIPSINIILFFITLASTIFAGAMQEGVNPFKDPFLLYKGLPFSLTLLLILGTHEMGHYLMSKRHGVEATLPFFIPAPTFLGTFGAIIRMKSPVYHRIALFDIGVAGPFAGFCVAVPAVIIGLKLSVVQQTTGAHGVTLGSSILFSALVKSVFGSLPADQDIFLNPVAFAGWIGLFITALNLLPVGQLDGGHIIYALFRKKHTMISRFFFFALVPFGFLWPGWLIWAVLISIMGFRHPPLINENVVLDRKRKVLGNLAIVIFLITFIPSPFTIPS